MPYKPGTRLAGERASRLGHLDVLKSEHVNKLIKSFESRTPPVAPIISSWQVIPSGAKPLRVIFGVDGSMAYIDDSTGPLFKRIAFVKTALLKVDNFALSKIDKETPHPLALKDILTDSALYHATAFPLRHVSVSGLNTYHAIRGIIYESLKDPSLSGWPMETLKWIAYEKWSGQRKHLPEFECPHCEKDVATLPYDQERGKCPNCNNEIFVTDTRAFIRLWDPIQLLIRWQVIT